MSVSADKVATRVAYGKTLLELGEVNGNVVVMDADLSKSTMTADFAKKFPERFVQMGISEQDMMSTAAGIASTGKTVFVSTFAVFATGRAWEQVRNSIAYPQMNVKICATHSGVTVGEDGGSHQSVEDIALMRVIPNMKVIVPSDAVSTRWAVKEAFKVNGPVYVRLGRLAVPAVYDEDEQFEFGKAKQLADGKDVTIVACGLMVDAALKAAEELSKEGISARVVDMLSVKPLDCDMLDRAAVQTGAIVTAEEHSVIGGLGAAVCEHLCGSHPVPVVRVGVNDQFGKSGKPDELLVKFNLTPTDIKAAAIEAVKMKAEM